MQHTTDTFQTTDGLNLHTVRWHPEGSPKAIVLIVHGIAEHSGRYQHVAEFLVNRGYAVHSLDHRGHGKSEGTRVYFDTFEQPVNDLERYFDGIYRYDSEHKIYLYGHSMGSLISLLFLLRRQVDAAGFISTGTPLTVDQQAPAVLRQMGGILNRLVPRLHLIPLNAGGVSRDPDVVAAYSHDPLVYHRAVRAGMAFGIARSSQTARERLNTLRLPMLILHGGADPLTPPSGSQYLFDNAGSPDKTLKIYPGLYHEVHNEPEKTGVLSDIAAWLDDHVIPE